MYLSCSAHPPSKLKSQKFKHGLVFPVQPTETDYPCLFFRQGQTKLPQTFAQHLVKPLREAARPDSDFIGWYEPAIGPSGSEPDFILFGNSLGLLVLEVKGWDVGQNNLLRS